MEWLEFDDDDVVGEGKDYDKLTWIELCRWTNYDKQSKLMDWWGVREDWIHDALVNARGTLFKWWSRVSCKE